jgi:hypothetical protein
LSSIAPPGRRSISAPREQNQRRKESGSVIAAQTRSIGWVKTTSRSILS